MQEGQFQSFSTQTFLRTPLRGLARYLARTLARALALCRAGIIPPKPVPEPASIPGMDLLRHELRAPLTGILGMCELLQRSELTGEQFQLAGAVEESGKQLLRIIARFDADKPGVIEISQSGKHAVNGAVMLEQVIRAHWPAAHRKGIGLFLLYDHRLPVRWQTDVACLRQLLDNLLSNAIKFTVEGHVLVEVRLSQLDSSGRGDVELAVSDTGIGITPRDARRIYSIREQGSGGVAKRFEGSGLGLYVCSYMASLLGGCITHESPGLGRTCFQVKLPGLVEPGASAFNPLQPGLLRDLKCLLAMNPPQAAVLEHLLRRIGVQLAVNADPRGSGIPAGVDVVICDEMFLLDGMRKAPGVPARNRLLLLSHPYAPNPVPVDTAHGVVATELPHPILRSNLEPLLLRMALERKMTGAERDG